MIIVKYFASLKERLGKAQDEISTEQVNTVQDVWRLLHNGDIPKGMLMAINHDYAQREATVTDGDEVAFFPPVTGG